MDSASLEVARKRGGALRIDEPSLLARGFFATDISSAGPASYDERARATDPMAPFVEEDIEPIRTGMRLGRLKTETWQWLVEESPRDFLNAIDPSWDLITLEFDDWIRVRPTLKAAVAEFIGDGRQAAVATKMLHFKRPRLVPILDSLVLTMLGTSVPEFSRNNDPARELEIRDRAAEGAVQACDWLRAQAAANAVTLKAIQDELAAHGTPRSLVRIFDALLWSVHPASEVSHQGLITWSPHQRR